MPNITDARAIDFSNKDIRTGADQLVQTYYRFKDVLARWNANGQNITALFTNTINDPVVDGAPGDSRPPITSAHVNNVISRMNEFVTDMEAGGNLKLNTLLAVAVNHRPGIRG